MNSEGYSSENEVGAADSTSIKLFQYKPEDEPDSNNSPTGDTVEDNAEDDP